MQETKAETYFCLLMMGDSFQNPRKLAHGEGFHTATEWQAIGTLNAPNQAGDCVLGCDGCLTKQRRSNHPTF